MRRLLAALLSIAALASPLGAQQDTTRPPGIRLITRYDPATRPALAVKPFSGSGIDAAVLDSLTTIVRRDLEYSDRFTLLQVPAALATAASVDYKQWDALRVMYVVTGVVAAGAAGFELELTVHDVVRTRIWESRRLRLPAETSPAFRLAVHAASDEVVRIITGRPGIAATRIAFTRQNPRGTSQTQTYDLLVVDSDGFGQRRLGGTAGLIYSPDWSPDGSKILYTQNNGGWRLVERDVASGTQRTIDIGVAGMVTTPAYSPDGRRVAVAVWRTDDMDLYEYDLAGGSGLRRLTQARGDDQSPTYSGDGSRIAFMTNRLRLPHIYVMPAAGGAQQPISPYVHGQLGYYTSPDWSPTGTEIAFHGHWNSRGTYQIMVADASRPGSQIRQLTSTGANEDPSWAPDGRHLVFTHSGVRGTSPGLYVVDTGTGNRRPLTTGSAGYRLADWSPVLLRAAQLVVAGP
jgi:TolB protein